MTAEEAQLFEVFTYQRELFRYRLMDELAYDLIRLMDQGAEIRDPPTHILCDEYQDFTPGELLVFQRFAELFGTWINAAGDDRQSIYRFRAADPRALERFADVYGIDEVDYLWRSRRCPQRVCDLANLIGRTLGGLDRPELAPWDGRADAGVIELTSATTPGVEAGWVVARCAELMDEGVSHREIIVVAAGYVDEVLSALNEHANQHANPELRFFDPRIRTPYTGDAGVRLLGAGVRLLIDSEDQMAWRRLVAETPGLGTARLDGILAVGDAPFVRSLRSMGERNDLCARPVEAGDGLLAGFAGHGEVSGSELVQLLAEQLRIEDIDLTLVTDLAGARPLATPADWLDRILDAVDDEADQREPGEVPHGIPVYTVFGAKGLEARVVFLANALSASFAAGGDVADGVRRAYVGVSRPMERLIVSAPLNLTGSTLTHQIGAAVGGIAASIDNAANRLGLHPQVVRARDITR
jgi:superfamily I DNA/RNA helicase